MLLLDLIFKGLNSSEYLDGRNIQESCLVILSGPERVRLQLYEMMITDKHCGGGGLQGENWVKLQEHEEKKK